MKRSDLDVVPEITGMLKSGFKTVKAAIATLRFSSETAAIEFFRVFDQIPVGDRDYIPIEAVCLKAGVAPSALIGCVMMASRQIKGQESALIAVNAFPGVVKSMVEFAALPGGDRDRRMLSESNAIGFLPTKTGGNVNVNLSSGNPVFGNPERQIPTAGPVAIEAGDENFGDLFPGINSNLERWSDNRRKMLEASN